MVSAGAFRVVDFGEGVVAADPLTLKGGTHFTSQDRRFGLGSGEELLCQCGIGLYDDGINGVFAATATKALPDFHLFHNEPEFTSAVISPAGSRSTGTMTKLAEGHSIFGGDISDLGLIARV